MTDHTRFVLFVLLEVAALHARGLPQPVEFSIGRRRAHVQPTFRTLHRFEMRPRQNDADTQRKRFVLTFTFVAFAYYLVAEEVVSHLAVADTTYDSRSRKAAENRFLDELRVPLDQVGPMFV